MEQLKVNLPARRNMIQNFFCKGPYKSPTLHFGAYQKKLNEIRRLKKELEQKKATFYHDCLDENAKRRLSVAVSNLYEQISDLESEIRSPKEKQRIERISKGMQKKFESGEYPVLIQQAKSSE